MTAVIVQIRDFQLKRYERELKQSARRLSLIELAKLGGPTIADTAPSEITITHYHGDECST